MAHFTLRRRKTMFRSRKSSVPSLFLAVILLVCLLPMASVAGAAPLAQGESYTVQKDDNLWIIAEKYLGSGAALMAIVQATNAKQVEDPSFAEITDAALIQPGWKLWIPSKEEAESLLAALPPAPAAGKRALDVTFAWPTYIDPAVGSDFSSTSSLCNLYDTLVFPNTAGGVDPQLAENWDVSGDGLTWTFHLKKGVKFHNGSELTASDVAFSMNRLLEIGEGLAYVFLGTVESATALDDYTVEFKLTAPSGLFLISLIRLYVADEEEVMANIVTPGPYGDKGDYGKEYLLTHDAGSGPYKVKEFPLEEYLLMEKNPDWFGTFAPNAPDEVRFIATTETATVRTLMARRELEITDQWQTIEALEALGEMGGVDVAAFPVLTEFYYMIHTKKPPTDDVHFRRAMAYAFDYDAAVALEWSGTQQSRGPVPAITAGHDPDVFVFQRDLWITEVPAEEKWALLFQANMAEVGINVEIVGTPWMSVVEEMASQEQSPHIVTIYVSADFPEAGSLLKVRYHSDAAATWSQNEWLLDEALDQRINDALVTVNQDERYAKYRELQNYIVDLCPSIFLYDQVQKHAYQSAYVDWPAARGEVIPVMGYTMFAPTIGVTGP
jgi:peptide/nickel transport system substrate-binding protein